MTGSKAKQAKARQINELKANDRKQSKASEASAEASKNVDFQIKRTKKLKNNSCIHSFDNTS